MDNAAYTGLFQRARDTYITGDFARAWRICVTMQEKYAVHPGTWELSCRVAAAMGHREQALALSRRALDIAPDRFEVLTQYAECLIRLNKRVEARRITALLATRSDMKAVQHDALGNLLSQLGDQDSALKHFDQAVTLATHSHHFYLNRALTRQSLGQLAQAESDFDRVIALKPDLAEAYLHRSRLRRQTAEANHVDQLASLIAAPHISWRDRISLGYALAKEYEDLGLHDSSFEQLAHASALRRNHMRHDAEADLEAMQIIIETFSADYFEDAESGFPSKHPIFIVGLPRTGTTLVERVISAHSAVHAAGELNTFAECLTALIASERPRGRLDFIRKARTVNVARLGRDYCSSVRARTGWDAHFIDKLPLNYLYCGLIHRALPDAKIIHLNRHPMDTCYAIYKTLFKQAYPFSYDLQELGNYYLAYQRLMQHWRDAMPDVILDLCYERFVANPEEEIRHLLAACDLPWEDACLHFDRSTAPSMTASLAQVRQPIYTSSVNNWRHYRKHLSPLEEMLVTAGVEIE